MIVYAQVFETKYRTSMADYTLPYQKNHDLDYEFIANKCENLVQGIGEFDARLHQMDSNENKTLIYYFKYVKKTCILSQLLITSQESMKVNALKSLKSSMKEWRRPPEKNFER